MKTPPGEVCRMDVVGPPPPSLNLFFTQNSELQASNLFPLVPLCSSLLIFIYLSNKPLNIPPCALSKGKTQISRYCHFLTFPHFNHFAVSNSNFWYILVIAMNLALNFFWSHCLISPLPCNGLKGRLVGYRGSWRGGGGRTQECSGRTSLTLHSKTAAAFLPGFLHYDDSALYSP